METKTLSCARILRKLPTLPINHHLCSPSRPQYPHSYSTPAQLFSEHSDKTINVVRGSHIVNLSLGARRTMTLRAKKMLLPTQRGTSRVVMMTMMVLLLLPLVCSARRNASHFRNSLFVTGLETICSLVAQSAYRQETGEH